MTTAGSAFLLDTNAYLNGLRTAPAGKTFLLPAGAQTAVSVVTEVELRYGVAAAPGDARRLASLTHLLSHWTPVPVDAAVATAFSSVVVDALAGGQTPRRRMNDLMIAATALVHGMTLVTNDRSLTTAVDGLVPVQPLF